jgi:hypothetical protein
MSDLRVLGRSSKGGGTTSKGANDGVETKPQQVYFKNLLSTENRCSSTFQSIIRKICYLSPRGVRGAAALAPVRLNARPSTGRHLT